MFQRFRRKPKNVNYLEDIFDLAEKKQGPKSLCKSMDQTFSLMKKELNEYYPQKDSDANLTFKELEEYSPFLSHYIKNEILKDISRNILESELVDDTKLRHCEKIKKKFLYVNLNQMTPIAPNIDVMDKNGNTLKITDSLQDVFGASFTREFSGKKVTVEAQIYFGVLKE